MQAPVFISLFHVLRLIGTPQASALYNEYHWTQAQAASAGKATVFGAPIASAFTDPRNLVGQIPGASATATHVVALVLIVLMVGRDVHDPAAGHAAQHAATLDSQQAMIQKLMLYGVPASLTVSGFFFPIGVLFYWFTNNLWSMGQQFYILKRMPHPNAKKDTVDPEVGEGAGAEAGAEAGPADQADTAAIERAGRRAGGRGRPDADRRRPPPARRRRAASADGASANGKAPGSEARPGAKPAAGADPRPSRPAGRQARGRSRPTGADAAEWRTTPSGGRRGRHPARNRPPAASRPKPGPGARPGGAGGRRPQGQRSPTQTRQKKKRR